MLRKFFILSFIAVIVVFCLNGCKDRSSGTQSDQEEAKTAAEYEAEAEEQITRENMAQELERIEKAIDQDISREP